LEEILTKAFLIIPASPAGQKIIASNSVSRIGNKSAINMYFQKTGTGSDDFQKI
jgi:hypothetical protein